jgi:hypothetical protein
MKNLTRFVIFGILAAVVALPLSARNSPPFGASLGQAAQQPDDAEKNKLYEQFTAAYAKYKASSDAKSPSANDDYKAAYDVAKQYVEKYGSSNDDYSKYFRDKFIPRYETYQKSLRKSQIDQFINDKKYPEAFALGKQILADEPDDELTMFKLTKAAIIATTAGNEASNAEATTYAKKAIDLINNGKFQPESPNQTKDVALAILNYGLGLFTMKSSPTESAAYLFKAVQYDSGLKKEAPTYGLLASAYETEYLNVATEYKTKFPDATTQATPEGKAATEKVNAVTDRLIDAYARAVAYAGTDAKYATPKQKWLDRLTELYKYRHDGSDAGLKELIAGVTSKPLPTLGNMPPASSTSSTAQPAGAGN